MAISRRLVAERTDLGVADVERLASLVRQWSLLADLGLSDLVLWVPTWNDGGLVAVAQVRPTTAPTAVPDDVVGEFSPRGRHPSLDQAVAFGRAVALRDGRTPEAPVGTGAYPVRLGGRVIGVVARHASAEPRVAGRLEGIYLATADDLLDMLVEGRFPVDEAEAASASAPRVGDGLVRLDPQGRVEYASPNAVSALRRLGLASDVVGSSFADLVVRLSRRTGPVDEVLSAVASGRGAGRADIETAAAIVTLHGIPLRRGAASVGAILFLQDATDLRRRERALVSKDATIREIHHRVKNNLQTVAAVLRMQARRASSPEARDALAEAELRVAAIAVVHESLSAEEGERVDFDPVVDRIIALVGDLAPAYSPPDSAPALVREGSWGTLPGELATSLAMVASELLHNAVEHAQARRIVVELDRAGAGLVMRVVDDGRGLPAGFDPAATGLGLSIVRSLVADDLGGTFEVAGTGHGTAATIVVPTDGASE
ncbi:MAG: sensor histidine kinase [Actinomycetota bacterium]|nr:sensor histidine kinase [Actinomycetota bacterium]